MVHQICKFQNQKEFLKDLKCVYQAVNKESAEDELLKLDENGETVSYRHQILARQLG